MKISKINTFKLGLYIVAGLIIFFLGIYYLGKQQNLFRSTITVMTEFKNVKGIQVGNSIRFLGINVGSVSDISISNDTVVIVKMELDRKLSQYIREDSKVEIKNEGVMGTKIINIQPGSSQALPIEENAVLPSASSLTIEEIFGSLEGTVHYSTEAAKNLMDVTEKIKSGEGDLGKLINDNTLKVSFDSLSKNLMYITQDAREIVKKANKGDNDLSRLLNRDTITSHLNRILTEADSIAGNLKTSSKEIKKTTQEINHGNGLMNKVLYDSVFAEDVDTSVVKIKNGIDDIIKVSDAIGESWILNIFKRNKGKRNNKTSKED